MKYNLHSKYKILNQNMLLKMSCVITICTFSYSRYYMNLITYFPSFAFFFIFFGNKKQKYNKLNAKFPLMCIQNHLRVFMKSCVHSKHLLLNQNAWIKMLYALIRILILNFSFKELYELDCMLHHSFAS